MPFKFNPITHKLDIVSTGGGGGGSLDTLTGNTGGAISPDGSNNIYIVGSGGLTVAGNDGTNTLTISAASPFFAWTVITANQAVATQSGYFVNGAGRLDLTLPATAAVGDTYAFVDIGGNGWRVVQNASQNIRIGNQVTTTGAGGSLASTNNGDSLYLVCAVANTTWIAVYGWGNITVV